MSYRHREIESKLLVKDASLEDCNRVLARLLDSRKTKMIFGSSVDTYWPLPSEVKGQFIRMRERDGIRQITVKAEDRGNHLNRVEIDIDSTSPVKDIVALMNAAHGRSLGRIGKTYYVYWIGESEHTTICCYSVNFPDDTHLWIDSWDNSRTEIPRLYPHCVVEVETTSMGKMLDLETEVVRAFEEDKYEISRAPGSLYTMFLSNKGDNSGK